MADELIVVQVVRYAFIIRLAALLFVVLDPAAVSTSTTGYLSILFITGTSALGLFATVPFTRWLSRHPLAVMVDVLVAALVGVALGIQSPIVVFSTSTAVLIGILLPLRYGVLVLTVLVSSYVLTTVAQSDTTTVMSLTLTPVSYITICLLAALTRSLHHSAMIDNARARRASEDAARERERSRLAREMHDSVAKSLHGIGLAAAALPTWIENHPEQVGERARELQAAAEAAARDARAILVGLRTDTSHEPLAKQVRVLAEDLSMGGVRTSLSLAESVNLRPEVKREVVSVIAEALENVRRHSEATQVEIRVTDHEAALEVLISDNGVGFDPASTPSDHFGLVGIHERAHAIGATCLIDTAIGEGTRVSLKVPHEVSERA